MSEQPRPDDKMRKLLQLIGNFGQCRGCNAPMYWLTTKAGKPMPVNPDGTPHWATCPKSREFKIQKQKERLGYASRKEGTAV